MTDLPPPDPTGHDSEVWYHRAGESVEGPLEREEILRLLARGVVPPSAPVWRPGMEDWTPARRVPALTDLLPPGVDEVEAGAGSPSGAVRRRPERRGSSDGGMGQGLSVWGPVAAAAVVILGAGFAVSLFGSGDPRGGVGTEVGILGEILGPGSPAGTATLSEEQLGVARSHVAALEDSLRRLPRGDSLAALRGEGGLSWTRRVGFGGLHRLEDRFLVEHAELMGRALAEAPEDLCAAVAQWRASSRQYWSLLGGLSPSGMRRFLEVLRAGVMAELRGRTPWPAPDPEEVSTAFSLLGERLPEPARDSLLRVLSPQASPSPAESCWAERTLYGSVPQVPDPWRAVLARAAVTG